MPSIPASISALNARYGFAVGSGERNSIRLLLGDSWYIGILRQIWARQGPVTNEGEHYPLPLPDGTGLAKPLKASIHPLREDIPIYLAAEGPKNIALAAELCDGWLALFYSPHHDDFYRMVPL